MYRKSYAEIQLDHLRYNWEVLQKNFSDRFVCPMVKANAYGHGDVMITRYLEKWGARQVGVCLIEEGLLLRKNKIKLDILVFRGFDKEGARVIIENKMTPVVSSWEHLDYLEEVATEPLSIHLKFNTGMNRLGFNSSEAIKVFERVRDQKLFKVRGVLTHLSQGEDSNRVDGDSALQLEKMFKICQQFNSVTSVCHALNSAAIIHSVNQSGKLQKDHPLELIKWGLRPGLMLYGYNSLGDDNLLKLKPVMSFKSNIGALRNVSTGEGVSYNSTWKAPKDSVIAVVPVGYADGFHRLLSNRGEALVCGNRVPIVGNICMDYLMLDVTNIAQVQTLRREQEVTFFGSDENNKIISAAEVAQKSQTISWEVLTSVGERMPRVYIDQDEKVNFEK